jgi:signal peptidase I
LFNAQRDIMPEQGVEAVSAALLEAETALKNGVTDESAKAQMVELEKVADKWIKPYPHSEWRENLEVFLVAIAVAMAVRTFFLQPFKIPTGSMQPTLYGVVVDDLHDKPDVKIPGALEQIWDAVVYGQIFHEVIAPEDCRFLGLGPLKHPVPFINKQDIVLQYADGSQHTIPIWFGPDDTTGWADTGIRDRGTFRKGEPILRYRETTGDHLFVDRMTYNFRLPERGEIIVFKTRGIPEIADQTQFYIKRLVGLPGETISIGTDQHARINGVRLDASTPHFENVYGFVPGTPRQKDHYSGHVLLDDYRVLLQKPTDTITVDPASYAVFGDNTMNSFDSRFWHELPQKNVIGKSFFVYWPISKRFGWGHTVQ